VSGRAPGSAAPRRGAARAATLLAAALVLMLAEPAVRAAKQVPALAARVNDLAGMIPPPARERIEARLADLERRTGAQVAVLTVESLDGDTIEALAERVFRTWGLGRRGVDDGALLVVARRERRMRIETGYGLEERLTDLRSREILDGSVRPHFRDGNFAAGIEAGVDAIARTIEGAPLPPPRRARPHGFGSPWGPVLFAALFILVVATFSVVALAAPGAAGWFLYLFLVPFYAAVPAAMFPPYGGVVAAGAWLVLFPVLRALLHTPRGKRLRARYGWVASPGASGGRWRGAGSSGGRSAGGGGGFSGGGGRAGGGGASSSW
jgi:uncharacterized protein